MELNDEGKALAATRVAANVPAFDVLTPTQARDGQRAARIAANVPPPEVGAVRDMVTEAGVPLRMYRPAGTGTGEGAEEALPGIVFFHGGGFVIGDLDSHDHLCRLLVRGSAVALVAVDYRLAPEHVFPAAVEDAFEAVRWVVANADTLGLDPKRIGVAGDSAGGNLAAVCAIAARDGDLPALACQALVYPCTDLTGASASYDKTTPGLPVDGGGMRWFLGHYLADASVASTDWRASPILADLAGVAPAYVLTLGHDPCRDEGLVYAEALRRAGVSVTADHIADQFHGILTIGAGLPSAGPVTARLAARLVEGLGASPAGA